MTKTKQSVQRSTRKAAPSAANRVRTHMVVKMLDLASIVPYKRNPRKRPPAAVAAVAASLKKFGWQQPIVVDTKNVIAVGHTRHAAALSLGWESARVELTDPNDVPATPVTPISIRG